MHPAWYRRSTQHPAIPPSLSRRMMIQRSTMTTTVPEPRAVAVAAARTVSLTQIPDEHARRLFFLLFLFLSFLGWRRDPQSEPIPLPTGHQRTLGSRRGTRPQSQELSRYVTKGTPVPHPAINAPLAPSLFPLFPPFFFLGETASCPEFISTQPLRTR